MTYDRNNAQQTYRRFKSALTRAVNKKDWQGVLLQARKFRDYYRTSDEPMPDFWSRWQRAADDAYFNLQRQGITCERVDIS